MPTWRFNIVRTSGRLHLGKEMKATSEADSQSNRHMLKTGGFSYSPKGFGPGKLVQKPRKLLFALWENFFADSSVVLWGKSKRSEGSDSGADSDTDSRADSGTRIGRESIKTQNRPESVFLLQRRNSPESAVESAFESASRESVPTLMPSRVRVFILHRPPRHMLAPATYSKIPPQSRFHKSNMCQKILNSAREKNENSGIGPGGQFPSTSGIVKATSGGTCGASRGFDVTSIIESALWRIGPRIELEARGTSVALNCSQPRVDDYSHLAALKIRSQRKAVRRKNSYLVLREFSTREKYPRHYRCCLFDVVTSVISPTGIDSATPSGNTTILYDGMLPSDVTASISNGQDATSTVSCPADHGVGVRPIARCPIPWASIVNVSILLDLDRLGSPGPHSTALTLIQMSAFPGKFLQDTSATPLDGISTVCGLWTFVNGTFLLFFGANFMYFAFGRRPLSALGIAHIFQRRTLTRRWHEDFPALQQPGSESAGVVAFIRERLVDIESITEDPEQQTGDAESQDLTAENVNVERQSPCRRPNQKTPKKGICDISSMKFR
ncbi:hypothetical protein C8R47DRAFT_1250710 [Mycena vitilis]|nr:hypothetical protein C8R47DRAFT_1250710 [Mycena vitilis]